MSGFVGFSSQPSARSSPRRGGKKLKSTWPAGNLSTTRCLAGFNLDVWLLNYSLVGFVDLISWNLRTVFLAVATVAAFLGVFSGFWNRSHPNHELLLGVYILLVSAIAVVTFPAHARFRNGLLAACVFGVVYFICVLKGGFGIYTIQDSRGLVKNTLMGCSLIAVSFMVAQLVTTVFLPGRVTPENQEHAAEDD